MQIYKYVVHNVAHNYGKTATFMPKPILGDNGSGMHVHQSIWKAGKPLFAGSAMPTCRRLRCYYIGGIIKHAKAINAFTNPTTNSYKRLIPGFEAPVLLAYSARNRSASCRIPLRPSPKGKRVEVRFPDPAANPYLGFAAMLMAGLDGIQNKIHPGEPMDKNLYDLPPEELKERSDRVRLACARRSAAWKRTTPSCSRATCSPRTSSRPTWSCNGKRCTSSSTRRTRSSSRCTTRSELPGRRGRAGCHRQASGRRHQPRRETGGAFRCAGCLSPDAPACQSAAQQTWGLPMTAYPLTALATILALLVYAGLGAVVTRARGRYGVAAPATSGHPEFDRRYRVHVNTLEQIVILLPVLWLTAAWIGDAWAGLGGLVWCVGRIVYARGYYREAGRREIGFYITAVPVVLMTLAVTVAVVIKLA